MEQTVWAERGLINGALARILVYAGLSGVMSGSARQVVCLSAKASNPAQAKSPVSTRQKQCEPGEDASLCISCIALQSLHARLHSTPRDQTSGCGRWAAEASQEAACLLTTVGAAVEQANPGSVTACIESRQRAAKQ
jgi:hypothetical protein